MHVAIPAGNTPVIATTQAENIDVIVRGAVLRVARGSQFATINFSNDYTRYRFPSSDSIPPAVEGMY
jgi:hypothetical protein